MGAGYWLNPDMRPISKGIIAVRRSQCEIRN
jgi:hypothetical protein